MAMRNQWNRGRYSGRAERIENQEIPKAILESVGNVLAKTFQPTEAQILKLELLGFCSVPVA
jgi:hypothetical protein